MIRPRTTSPQARALPAVAALLAAAALAPPVAADPPEGAAGLVAPGAAVEKLADGFKFTEGPACDRARADVYFSDIPNNRIHKWSKGVLTTWREESGGANGLQFDGAGALVVCEGGNRRVTRITPALQVSVVADRYGGKPLNSPNDLWVGPGGGIYFSDPRYGDTAGMEQDGMHVYYVPARSGDVRRVTTDLVKPNGVIGTPYAEKLYVADQGADKTWVYRIAPDGSLADKQLFAAQGSDGLTLDERGNLYLTGDDGISVYSAEGKRIATLAVPEKPSNLAFCGEEMKTLFITARTGLYSLQMSVSGQ